MIAQRIEQERERVVRFEVAVAPQGRVADRRGKGVVRPHAHPQALRCCEQTHDRPFSRGPSFGRLSLGEVGDGVGREPGRLVGHAVEPQRGDRVDDVRVGSLHLGPQGTRAERARDDDAAESANEQRARPSPAVPPILTRR